MVTTAAELQPTLHAACRRWAGRPAVTFAGATLTYGELWERVEALARSYRRLGVRPGDRIVCQLRNCPEHLVALNAAWACGAIHAGTDNDLTGAELAWLVERTEATVLVFQPRSGVDDPLSPLGAVRRARPSPGTPASCRSPTWRRRTWPLPATAPPSLPPTRLPTRRGSSCSPRERRGGRRR